MTRMFLGRFKFLSLLLLLFNPIAAFAFDPRQVVISVAPFAAGTVGNEEVGKRTSTILNLQIWQTLRIPTTPEGRNTKGVVTWDFDSRPPTTFLEAERYAAAQTDQEPAIVLWGRAWHYGSGVIVESFLSIRPGDVSKPYGSDLLSAKLSDGTTFSVGIPRRQIDFEPIILKSEIMPELSEPAGLKLYKSSKGDETEGFVGDYFKALEQGPDSAKVVLPNGTQGWIRLPSLSRERSEVVDFSGGIVRILRSDWSGATQLFQRVATNAHAPTAVKVDSYLYLAIAAANSGGDPAPWLRKAYDLNPYSKTILEYLCMDQLRQLAQRTSDKQDQEARIRALTELVRQGKPLYSANDPWFVSLKKYLQLAD
jgi:hypothetical protein